MSNLNKTPGKTAEPAKKAINTGREKAKAGKTAPLGAKAKGSEPGLAEKAMSTSTRKAPVHSMSSETCEAAEAKSANGKC